MAMASAMGMMATAPARALFAYSSAAMNHSAKMAARVAPAMRRMSEGVTAVGMDAVASDLSDLGLPDVRASPQAMKTRTAARGDTAAAWNTLKEEREGGRQADGGQKHHYQQGEPDEGRPVGGEDSRQRQ